MPFKRFSRSRSKGKSGELQPGEVMFEAQNLLGYNYVRGEGRKEKSIPAFAVFLPLVLFLLIFIFLMGRINFLQKSNAQGLADQANSNAFGGALVIANRGTILDRNQIPLAWNEPGETGEDFAIRKYIEEPGFNHLTGFLSEPKKDKNEVYYQDSYIPRSGLELIYNDVLKGDNGVEMRQETATSDLTTGVIIEPAQDGSDLIISVDAEIQSALYESIKTLSETAGFKGGSGAIMDMTTGELIALTNYPEFSRSFDDVESEGAYSNLFTHGLYTPGSVVKPIMAIAALNEGVISPNKEILSTKTITIPNRYNPDNPSIFSDWRAHGYVNVRDALALSSNIYFYAVGGGLRDQAGLGITKINKYFSAFELDQPANVVGYSAVSGTVPSPKWKEEIYEDGTWRLGDTYLTSIGQFGFQVTPLQMLKTVNMIAQNGTWRKPHYELGRTTKEHQVPLEIEDEVYKIVNEGMRQAVVSGTAKGLNVSYVDVAAKTGTAELGQSKETVNSWTMGYFPSDEPKYAFVVLMHDVSRFNLTGATYAMRQTLDWMHQNTPRYFR